MTEHNLVDNRATQHIELPATPRTYKSAMYQHETHMKRVDAKTIYATKSSRTRLEFHVCIKIYHFFKFERCNFHVLCVRDLRYMNNVRTCIVKEYFDMIN